MASQGPFFPTSGTNVAVGVSSDWTTPGTITAEGGTLASVTIAPENNSSNLYGSGHGFSIPTGATIDGIKVELFDDTPSPGYLYVTKNGTAATGETIRSNGFGAWVEYGGATSLWATTWTPAEVNATTFGFFIYSYSTSPSGNVTSSVDAGRVTVYYTSGQFAYPDADTASGTWTTTPLWSKVDEPTTPSDTDFITSTAT